MKRATLFLSIHPRFAEQIFAGTKKIELRRVRPRVTPGDLVIVYASGDTKALMGAFQVDGVVAAAPSGLWRRFKQHAGLSKREFDEYFAGVNTAFGIQVSAARRLTFPLSLDTLRKNQPGFRPPQSYHYLDTEAVISMGGQALLATS